MKKKMFLGACVSVSFAGAVLIVFLSAGKYHAPSDNPSQEDILVSAHSSGNEYAPDQLIIPQPVVKQGIYKPNTVTVNENGFSVIEIAHRLRPIDIMAGEKMPGDLVEARGKGALAAITLRIINQDGEPVPTARVCGGFWNNEKSDGAFDKLTDNEGIVELQHMCACDVNLCITKEKYYATQVYYKFDKGYFDCVENGRWIPWNPTVSVLLKDHRNPAPLYVRQINAVFPKNETVGFDCLVGDFIEPFGKGTDADFYFWYESIRPPLRDGQKYPSFSCFTNSVTISIPDGGGFATQKKDKFSQFVAEYEAPNKGYTTELNYGLKRTTDKVFINRRLDEKEYLFFKSRVKAARANFGKVYRLGFGDSLKETNSATLNLSYYFNPTPNDRNLEFDGKNNLFKPDWRDTNWPREP
jgi:hypothetical protein